MQPSASSWALFHISHVQDKAQIDIGILYQNLVQFIKARTGGSIDTAGLISVLYYLIRHLHNIHFNTVPHCKISSHPFKNRCFHIHTPQFLSLHFSTEGKKIQDLGTTPAGSMKRSDGRKTGGNTSYTNFWITSLQVDRTKFSGDFRVGDSIMIHQTFGSKKYTDKEISQLGKNRRWCGKAANVVCSGLWHACITTTYLPARRK